MLHADRHGSHVAATRIRVLVIERDEPFRSFMARVLRDAGDIANARRTVLRALEAAPHFQRAQDLLLDLRAPAGGSRP